MWMQERLLRFEIRTWRAGIAAHRWAKRSDGASTLLHRFRWHKPAQSTLST